MLVLAGALAGTGDRADAAPAPAYRAAADRVCATANARLAAPPAPRTSEDVRTWVLRAVPIVSASVGRVRPWHPRPPSGRATAPLEPVLSRPGGSAVP